jgi:hypothetical protein
MDDETFSKTLKEIDAKKAEKYPVGKKKNKFIKENKFDVSFQDLGIWFFIIVFLDYFMYQAQGALGNVVMILSLCALLYVRKKKLFNKKQNLIFIPIIALSVSALWQSDALMTSVMLLMVFVFAVVLSEFRFNFFDIGASLAKSLKHLIPSWFSVVAQARKLPLGRLSRLRNWLPLLIPFVVCYLFVLIFQMANPVVDKKVSLFWEKADLIFENFGNVVPDFSHFMFWLLAGSVALILLFPQKAKCPYANCENLSDELLEGKEGEEISRNFFWTVINSLLMLNVLFVVYNYVDLKLMWLETGFPVGMNLNQYAQEGSFWLTVALLMTSLFLGALFQGRVNFSSKLKPIKVLAALWIVQNFIFALGTYRRLMIYVQYNGATPLRTVGVIGITLVVLGLLIVALKIKNKKSFFWMLRAQVSCVVVGLFIYYVVPTEYVEKKINTYMILRNETTQTHPAAFQIYNQPLSPSGIPALIPLLNCEDKVVREGVAAILRRERTTLRRWVSTNNSWKHFQISRFCALESIETSWDKIQSLCKKNQVNSKLSKLTSSVSGDMNWGYFYEDIRIRDTR